MCWGLVVPVRTIIPNGAAPQPDEACRGWLGWTGSGRRDLDRDRRAGPVYETAGSGLVGL